MAAAIEPFDWHRLLLSADAPGTSLWEVAFRSAFTFLLTSAARRITGKRGVRQLSLFEFGLLLVLGSAAGDAAFCQAVPLLYIVVVFGVVMTLYVLVTDVTQCLSPSACASPPNPLSEKERGN